MYRIGVDIGGTGIQAGLVNLEGKIVGQREWGRHCRGSHSIMYKWIDKRLHNRRIRGWKNKVIEALDDRRTR